VKRFDRPRTGRRTKGGDAEGNAPKVKSAAALCPNEGRSGAGEHDEADFFPGFAWSVIESVALRGCVQTRGLRPRGA